MFNIDEKYLYPMGDRPPHHEGCFPPSPPPMTGLEDRELALAEMRRTAAQLIEFKTHLEKRFEDIVRTLTHDNVIFKDTFANAHTVFLQEVKNEVNSFESNCENSLTLFKSNLEATYSKLAEECMRLIANNDATVEEAIRYMKTNLDMSVTRVLTEMVDLGTFDRLVENSVFPDFNNRLSAIETSFKTPELYGAKGDGVTSDDTAMETCIANLKSGDVLLLKGVYKVSHVLVKDLDNIRVMGTGGFILSPNAHLHAIEFNNCRNLVIDGITINGANRTARALNIYNVNDFEIRNVHIHDVGSDTADNSIYGIILVNSHNGRIVNPHINYVHAVSVATGINMESDGESVETTPTNIVIDGALIENIAPYQDGDGVKVLGTIESNITVMNSTFKGCAKRAIKFQSIGCTSFNNKIYSDGSMYACIDFQRKNGKSLNDTIYVTVPADVGKTGLGYYGVQCSDNTVVEGLNVHVNGIDEALYGACASSNLFGIQNLGEDEKIRVVIKNCKIDAWGYFLTNTTTVPCELVVEGVHINRMYMNYLFKGGTYENLVFLNNKIVNPPRDWFVFAHDTNCIINKCDIDLTNVMTAEWNVYKRPANVKSRMVARCGTGSFESGSFTFEYGRMTFYGAGKASPQNNTYSSGKWYALANIGDICYTGEDIDDSTGHVLGWRCTSTPSTDNPNGTWVAIYE